MTRTRSNKRVELTERDIALFKVLSAYRYLSSTTLYALVGGASEARFKDRLTVLFHEGFIDRPAQQWQFADCRHLPVIHEIGEGAIRTLKRVGFDVSTTVTPLSERVHRQFLHGVMICEIMASVALGLRGTPTRRLVTWRELLAKAPQSSRSSEHPFRLPALIASAAGRPCDDVTVEPDAMFGVEYGCEAAKSYRFFALEADRGTMPIMRSDDSQSSMFRKILAYRDVIARHVPRSQLGLPSLMVLIVTTSETRQRQVMNALAELSGASAPFLFKTFPMAGRGGSTTREEFTARPWLRVGYPSVRLEDQNY